MKGIVIVFIAGILLAVTSCGNNKENQLQAEIREMEEQIADDVTMDTAMAFKLTGAYIQFADENPGDTSAPYYLNRAADILKEIPEKRLKAINLYNRVVVKYPNHPLAPRGVFMIGFVFDEKYHDKERAAKSYTYFLEKYPNHPLAGDARNLLILLQDSANDELEQVHKWLQSDSTNIKNQE